MANVQTLVKDSWLVTKRWTQVFYQSRGDRKAHFSQTMLVIMLATGLTLWMPTFNSRVNGLVVNQAAYAVNYDRKNLRQQDFSGQDLTDNDYTRADLSEANLSHTNLVGVRLFTTHLDRANLEGANLTGATLDGATLIKANLKDAVLEGAYVISADFRGANIEGADFTDVLFDPRVNRLLCETASGVNPVTGRETRETLYCE
ncbi:MAG: pentapeptide repeat-containing protein [Phormidesmis sp.]